MFSACFLGAILLCQAQSAPAEIQEQLRQGQDAIYRLDFKEAERIFNRLIEEHPSDPTGYAFRAITLWNELLQVAGNLALDDYATPTPFTRKTVKPVEQETRRFKAANNELLAVCNRRLEKAGEDVLALYFKGVSFENLAVEAIAIRRNHLDAWKHARRANSLHSRVLELDPTFVDAKLSIAAAEFARATLPWSIRWLTVLFYPGDKEAALSKLTEVIENGRYRSLDAQVLMALLQSWKGDPRESVRILNELRARYPGNYLLDLNLAAIYQTTLDSPKQALEVYLELLGALDEHAPGLGVAEVHYRVATTYYRLREYGKALAALDQALHSSGREQETRALSAFMSARIHEEQGDGDKAREFYRMVVAAAPGNDTLKDEVAKARQKLR